MVRMPEGARAERERAANASAPTEANSTLKLLDTRLALALEAGCMGVWEWSVAQGRVFWSSALEAMHGIPVGSFDGTFEAYQRDIHPEDRERVLGTIQRTV